MRDIPTTKDAWEEYYRPVAEAMWAANMSPQIVYFVIDKVQYGFPKFVGVIPNDFAGQVDAAVFGSFEDAEIFMKSLPSEYYEVRATIIDDVGVRVSQD